MQLIELHGDRLDRPLQHPEMRHVEILNLNKDMRKRCSGLKIGTTLERVHIGIECTESGLRDSLSDSVEIFNLGTDPPHSLQHPKMRHVENHDNLFLLRY